jgi:hypothetical protein
MRERRKHVVAECMQRHTVVGYATLAGLVVVASSLAVSLAAGAAARRWTGGRFGTAAPVWAYVLVLWCSGVDGFTMGVYWTTGCAFPLPWVLIGIVSALDFGIANWVRVPCWQPLCVAVVLRSG